MSSALYTATCLARRDATVDIELVPTPAIDPHFPLSDFVGLAIVHESASAQVLRPGQSHTRWVDPLAGPLADELAVEHVIDLSCADSPARRATTAKYVVWAGYASTRHWKPSLCAPGADGVYRQGVDPRSPGAHAIQRELVDLATKSHVPSAVLRVELTDPRWCSHLEPGMQWDVYAFDDDAALLM